MGFAVGREGGVTTIQIDRPEAANALRRADKLRLIELLDEEGQAPTRVVILTGAGERAFCAGTDMKEMASFSTDEGARMLELEARLYDTVLNLPVPVIASVNGAALGAGCVLACCCDLVIASAAARFGQPEVRNGVPAPIHVALLPRIVGLGRARWLLYTTKPMGAEEARLAGLVGDVVPAEALRDRTLEIAAQLVALPATGLALQKQIVNGWLHEPFDDSVRSSLNIAARAFETAVPQQAIDTFLRSRHGRSR